MITLINHQLFLFLISYSCYFRYYLLFSQVLFLCFVYIIQLKQLILVKLAYLINYFFFLYILCH